MRNNGERGPIEAALADTAYEKRAPVGKEPFGVQWPIPSVPLAADGGTVGTVAVLCPEDCEPSADLLQMDLPEVAGDAAAALCRTQQHSGEDAVDGAMDWLDLTDGWAL